VPGGEPSKPAKSNKVAKPECAHSLGLFSSIKWQNQIGFLSFLNLALLHKAELQWLALLFFTHATNTGFYTMTRENKIFVLLQYYSFCNWLAL
jgi:hypothetical protein